MEARGGVAAGSSISPTPAPPPQIAHVHVLQQQSKVKRLAHGRSMVSHGRKVALGLVILLTVYAALTGNNTLKTQTSTIPSHFFLWTSFVSDYYLGEIHEAFQWILESDLTFVMFYAPWDAQSMEIRWEFSKAAKYFQDEIRFIAINCWWVEGECRQHFRHIHEFPVLMAFVGAGRGVQYRGPSSHVHMIRFLETMMQPLHLIHSFGALLQLQARHGTLVVGYFDFKTSPQPSGYVSFHNAALKALEKDPLRSTGFAVVTNWQIAQQLGLTTSKSVMMIRINETLEFSNMTLFRSDVLLQWVYENQSPMIQWLLPPKTKSRLLSVALESSGPALILFTPNNPLSPSMPYFDLLHEVVLDYHDCHKTGGIKNVIQHSIESTKHYYEENIRLQKMCTELRSKHEQALTTQQDDTNFNWQTSSMCCQSLSLSNCPNGLCEFCIFPLQTSSKPVISEICFALLTSVIRFTVSVMLKGLISSSQTTCSEYLIDYSSKYKVMVCYQILMMSKCRNKHTFDTCFVDTPNIKMGSLKHELYSGVDDKIQYLFENEDKVLCHRWAAAVRYSAILFPVSSPEVAEVDFTGLGCRTNDTLKFMAMDTFQYGIFSQQMGVNTSEFHHSTAVVIQNNQQEVQHVLQQLVTKHTLSEFIWNYTHGTLDRFLRTPQQKEHKDCTVMDSTICIQEITGNTFDEIAMDNTKDVVVLYYAPWCGFCAGLYHIYLTVADYFRSTTNLTFARINGDKNDLPWEFTMDSFPTIIFFPANRKSESSIFPKVTPITVANLVYFVLANLQEKTRLQIAITMCGSLCISQNRHRILSYEQTLLQQLLLLRIRILHTQNAIRPLEKLQDDVQLVKVKSLQKYRYYLVNKIQSVKAKLKCTRWLAQSLNLFPETDLSNTKKLLNNFDSFLRRNFRLKTASRFQPVK